METTVLARRLLIIVLIGCTFAILLAAFVQNAPRPTNRVHLGSAAPCFHPASDHCTPAPQTL